MTGKKQIRKIEALVQQLESDLAELKRVGLKPVNQNPLILDYIGFICLGAFAIGWVTARVDERLGVRPHHLVSIL